MFERVFHLRNWRWQFSLRGLLLLMAVIGVGLTIYRWPWEAAETFTTDDVILETRSTHRRTWNGQAVKHGPEWTRMNGTLEQINVYAEGKKVQRRSYGDQGELIEQANYRDKARHGPFKSGDGTVWVYQGDFVGGEQNGIWSVLTDRRAPGWVNEIARLNMHQTTTGAERPSNPIRVTQSWQAGRRQGEWTWTTLEGEILHAATFEDNDLVTWNDEPVVQQFKNWITAQTPANSALHRLFQLESGFDWTPVESSSRITFTISGSERLLERQACVFRDGGPPGPFNMGSGDSPAAVLCEFALIEGYLISYRYGSLWLTPATEAGSTLDDRTGVDRVRFAADSIQAADWNEKVVMFSQPQEFQALLTELFAGSQISLDLGELDPPERSPAAKEPVKAILELPRRDMLGLLLYRLGLRCEQAGTTLRISYRW